MMLFRKKMFLTLWCVLCGLLPLGLLSQAAYADTASDYLLSESIGASIVFNTNAYNDADIENLGIELPEIVEIESQDLVMVKSTSVLNVRSEGNPDATLLGKLYRDCGGIVLEQGDGWTMIESGDLVGWCNSDYLLFGEEAVEFAKEVGTMSATITKPCVAIFAEASDSVKPVTFASENTVFEVIYEVDEEWICIACENFDGFVKLENVDIEFDIDHGETIEVIKERKAKEEAEKKKLIRRNEAIKAEGDTLKLLATIIWCESRGEIYDGQLAVGAVIMNRVRSGAYPNDVYSVIYASGQFSPVKTGNFQKAYENNSASASCYQAAQEVLDGYTNVADMTHFRRKGNKDGYIIGNHVFY